MTRGRERGKEEKWELCVWRENKEEREQDRENKRRWRNETEI